MAQMMSPIQRAEMELEAIESALHVQPAEPAPQQPEPAEPQTGAQPEPEPHPVKQEQKDDYYQKWKSLDGMLRKKDDQIAELGNQVKQLMQQNEILISRIAETPQQQAMSNSAEPDYSTEFGEESVRAINTVTDARYGRKIKDLEGRIEQLMGVIEKLTPQVGNIGERLNQSDSERFQSQLSAIVPEWQTWYGTPGFDRYLDTSDDGFGRTLRDVFDQANASYNLKSMAAVFNAYKKTLNPEPKADPRASLVTPGSAGAGTPASSQPKVWRASEVESAYENQRRGKYTPEQWTAIDAAIMQAYVDGRIAPG